MESFKNYYNESEEPLMSDEEAKKTAEILGVRYQGYWGIGNEGGYTFTDPITKSTFIGRNFEHTKKRLEDMRREFEKYN